MNISKITETPCNIEPSLLQKIDKTIEILVLPENLEMAQQKNIGTEFDENIILDILSKNYQNVSIVEINSQNDLENLVTRKPDLVFSGVKYFYFHSKIFWLTDFLDLHDISYIASSRAAMENECDKGQAKNIIQKSNIRTAPYFTTGPGEYKSVKSIPIDFPLFIKPISGGNSIGIDSYSVVSNFLNFKSKILDIHQKHKSRSMVEKYLSGKEYSVGIFENRLTGYLIAMPIEIVTEKNNNGDRILDFSVKFNNSEDVIKVEDTKVKDQLSNLAKSAFKALGGKSFGRIDIKMDHNNVPNFVEANLMPGLNKGYFYRSCMINLGMSYDKMILTIVKNGLSSSVLIG